MRKNRKAGLLLALCLALLAALAAELAAPEGAVDAMAAVDAPCVALTFDDGPRRETTELLLDGLARRGIHATFFVVGTRIEGQEDILLRMEAEGHQIGIHSQNIDFHIIAVRANATQIVRRTARNISQSFRQQTACAAFCHCQC